MSVCDEKFFVMLHLYHVYVTSLTAAYDYHLKCCLLQEGQPCVHPVLAPHQFDSYCSFRPIVKEFEPPTSGVFNTLYLG